MEGDPRVSRPRLPKPYTEDQLVFLRSHIDGFEIRTRGHVRGDAKKFAIDRANEFLLRFGLPPDLQGVDGPEPRFREQIYNWYKNTVGRARRKLEGRTRPKKLSDRGMSCVAVGAQCLPASTSGTIPWSPSTSFVPPLDMPDGVHPHPQPQPQQQPQPSSSGQQLQPTLPPAVSVPVQVSSQNTIALSVTPSALRDAFLTPAIDPPTLSSLIQSYVLAHPSPSPLTPVIHALFDAATSLIAPSPSAPSAPSATSASPSTSVIGAASASTAPNAEYASADVLLTLLRRFVDACAFFPSTLVHADVSGPPTGPRALQSALRKSSIWAPITVTGFSAIGPTAHGSLSDEMERIKVDRQRRKDHVQWAQIHAAAIELGIVGGSSTASTAGRGQIQELEDGDPSLDTFSVMMVRDAVWEPDEVEWVAGIIVLRAIIRTEGNRRKTLWTQLLGAYEQRWKEIKDEARQALVTEVLLGARHDLARLDDKHVA